MIDLLLPKKGWSIRHGNLGLPYFRLVDGIEGERLERERIRSEKVEKDKINFEGIFIWLMNSYDGD